MKLGTAFKGFQVPHDARTPLPYWPLAYEMRALGPGFGKHNLRMVLGHKLGVDRKEREAVVFNKLILKEDII